MFSTLQAALGAWPTDVSHVVSRNGSLNEGLSFGNDNDNTTSKMRQTSAASVFVLAPKQASEDRVFVAPTFTPMHNPDALARYRDRPTITERRQQYRANVTAYDAVEPEDVESNAIDDTQISTPADRVQEPRIAASPRPFVPPFFVPPGAQGDSRSATVAQPDAMDVDSAISSASRESLSSEFDLLASHDATAAHVQHCDAPTRQDHGRPGDAMQEPASSSSSHVPRERTRLTDEVSTGGGVPLDVEDAGFATRSPSPQALRDFFEQERQSLWSEEARQSFHELVTSSGYVNRYRLQMKKKQRMIHQLNHPSLEITLCDGTKDHQTKYQSLNWTLRDGLLYRKPANGRHGQLRRHLDEVEAWDVLTREHLLSGHLGRDKLRKRLEQKYIGYTVDEIMLVLKECKRCGGKATNSDSNIVSTDDTPTGTMRYQTQQLSKDRSLTTVAPRLVGPFLRPQASNAMLP